MSQVNGTVDGHPDHYREIRHHYAEECSQDDIGTFLFTSESVGEGHPGTMSYISAMLYSRGFVYKNIRDFLTLK